MKKILGLTVWQIRPAIAVKANATSAIMSDAIIMGAVVAKLGAVRPAKTATIVIAATVGVPILGIAIGMTVTIEMTAMIETTAMTVVAIRAVIGTVVQRIVEIVARRIIGTII